MILENQENDFYQLDTLTNSLDEFYSNPSTSSNPIIIDNGSFNCRAGYKTNGGRPSLNLLNFPNYSGKLKKISEGNNILVGNEIPINDSFRYSLRSPFDNDVVVNFDSQENSLDYVFYHLNVKNLNNTPILMTETVCNPAISRNTMTELLFEKYNIDSVAYGIDSLFSYYNHLNKDQSLDGLDGKSGIVISLSYSACHIIPVLDGKVIFAKCRRLDCSGKAIQKYLSELLQLNVPHLTSFLYPNRISEITHRFLKFAPDNYFESVDEIFEKNLGDKTLAGAISIQLPYSASTENNGNNNADNEVDANQQNIKQDKMVHQLRILHNKNRLKKINILAEKIVNLQEKLQSLLDSDNNEVEDVIVEEDDENIPSVAEESQEIQNLKLELESSEKELELLKEKYEINQKIVNGEIIVDSTKNSLSVEEIEELKKKRREILNRKKERKQNLQLMNRRRGHHFRQKMKILTGLVNEEDSKKKQKKKKTKNDADSDDMFGENDNDWDVYKTISNQNINEEEDMDNEELWNIEERLVKANQILENEEAQTFANIEEYYQIKLVTEIYRAPELTFKPYIAGYNNCGLIESIENVLKMFDSHSRSKLIKHIYLTGGLCNIPNAYDRVYNELRPILPCDIDLNLSMTDDTTFDCIHGANRWLNSSNSIVNDYFSTRSEYNEAGANYENFYKQSPFSNQF